MRGKSQEEAVRMATALDVVRKFYPRVMSVHDSRKDIDIEVTDHDTQHSDVRKHRTCAMAVACKRKLKVDGAIISITTAYLVKGTRAMRFMLPPSVSREIVSFDRKAGFAPGQYKLYKVRRGRRIGAGGSGRSGRHNPSGPKHGSIHITEGVRTHLGSKDIS